MRKFYNDTKLWEEMRTSDADVKILLSDRNPGKSYAIKGEVLDHAVAGHPFIYLRRTDIAKKATTIEDWYADFQIGDVTSDYDVVSYWQGKAYLGHMRDDGKKTRELFIGWALYLSSESSYKSNAAYHAAGCEDIVYEEFVTDSLYLPNEPRLLESLISTVKRDGKVSTWLLGNSLSRVNPYFSGWGLRHVPRQEMGTTERYVHQIGNNADAENCPEIKIDVQIIPDLDGQSSGWISYKKAKNTIWVTRDFPSLRKRKYEYVERHVVYLAVDMYRFRCSLFEDENEGLLFWYIEPFTKEIGPDARVISNRFETIQDYQLGSVGWTPLIPEEAQAFQLLKNGHWIPCDNLTGEDFDAVLKNLKRL